MESSYLLKEPQIEQSSWSFPFKTIIFFLILLILVVVLIVVLLFKKHNKKTVVVDTWEIPRSKVQIIEKLGAGSFGEVYRGIVYNTNGHSNRNCAIKTVKGGAPILERKRFLVEAEIMKRFKAHHVVQLLGVVTKDEPTLIVMELMSKGDLKSYLLAYRLYAVEDLKRQSITLREQMQMMLEIADGMAYLSANKFVHRDLAARNCMVDWDGTVKIGDFGMTRDIQVSNCYTTGKGRPVPIRWTAPEGLKDRVFTSKSDVWSCAVVWWEILTLDKDPYQELDNSQVQNNVIAGQVLMPPENCPEILYNMMKRCWNYQPEMRPTFLELVEWILGLPNFTPNQNFPMVSYYHNRY